MRPTRIDVRANTRTYPILVGHGIVGQIDRWLSHSGITGRLLVVSSPIVWKRHGDTLMAALPEVDHLLVPDGERSKTRQTVARVYDWLIHSGADRGSTIIAVGGGVIGDTVGFAAATFLRGIDLVHVPTTLLAQVDSAVGGKVGINHPLGKNLIGAFHPPAAVISDPQLLDTLPRRELRAGLYEVVKYGVIASRPLFERLLTDLRLIFSREIHVMEEIISTSCRIKARIVEADERESDRRRVLNFGHTVGHALEAVTHYRRLRHGEAVAYGMLVAARLGFNRDLLGVDDHTALTGLIGRMGPLPSVTDLSASDVIAAMQRDKKIQSGRLHVVLPRGIGNAVIVDDVTESDIRRSLRTISVN